MERRNRSLKALTELTYVDSLDEYDKAPALLRWAEKYLDLASSSTSIDDKTFDLSDGDLKKMSELFYKNINFLKTHRVKLRKEIDQAKEIKKFLN